MLDAINSALDKKELPALEAGAMCYMLSKQGYLGDQTGHFHPHLVFWAERTEPKSWGAGMPGSPMIGDEKIPGRLTVFMIPVGKWSDGTPDSHDENDSRSALQTSDAPLGNWLVAVELPHHAPPAEACSPAPSG